MSQRLLFWTQDQCFTTNYSISFRAQMPCWPYDERLSEDSYSGRNNCHPTLHQHQQTTNKAMMTTTRQTIARSTLGAQSHDSLSQLVAVEAITSGLCSLTSSPSSTRSTSLHPGTTAPP